MVASNTEGYIDGYIVLSVNKSDGDYITTVEANVSQKRMETKRAIFLAFPQVINKVKYDATVSELKTKRDAMGSTDYTYDVTVVKNGKRKILGTFTINSKNTKIHLAGYFLNPKEDRAVVVIAEENSAGVVYQLSGCHLAVGFK
jgi:hypothetical protein